MVKSKGTSDEKAVVEIIPLTDNQGKKSVQSQIEASTSGGEEEVHFALITSSVYPTTLQEAMKNNEMEGWMGAMMDEMESFKKNSVWKLVPKPKDRKSVGCKWVFRKKEALHENETPSFKARLVAKGYSQKEGVDYDEIFSPVVKHTSIRMLLALVAQFNIELEQLDVKTAFLHGDLEETIYMEQPEGFREAEKEDYVCKLKRSLHKLKQSPRQWYKRSDSYMLQIGYY